MVCFCSSTTLKLPTAARRDEAQDKYEPTWGCEQGKYGINRSVINLLYCAVSAYVCASVSRREFYGLVTPKKSPAGVKKWPPVGSSSGNLLEKCLYLGVRIQCEGEFLFPACKFQLVYIFVKNEACESDPLDLEQCIKNTQFLHEYVRVC